MKTIVRITNDYNSGISHDYFMDDIAYHVNELNIFCDIENSNFINIVEQHKSYIDSKEDYKNKTIVKAIGYSQSDWQEYVIYHNYKSNELDDLIKVLKKTFTHKNDYIVEKFYRTVINGKTFDSEIEDCISFSVNNIEFPDKEDIKKAYISSEVSDFNEIEINID